MLMRVNYGTYIIMEHLHDKANDLGFGFASSEDSHQAGYPLNPISFHYPLGESLINL